MRFQLGLHLAGQNIDRWSTLRKESGMLDCFHSLFVSWTESTNPAERCISFMYWTSMTSIGSAYRASRTRFKYINAPSADHDLWFIYNIFYMLYIFNFALNFNLQCAPHAAFRIKCLVQSLYLQEWSHPSSSNNPSDPHGRTFFERFTLFRPRWLGNIASIDNVWSLDREMSFNRMMWILMMMIMVTVEMNGKLME